MLYLSRPSALVAIASVCCSVPRIARADATTLQIGVVPTDSYAEPYYGLDGGYFDKAGLDVHVMPFA